MYCRKCGRQIPDDSGFCSYCGADQAFNQVRVVKKKDLHLLKEWFSSSDLGDIGAVLGSVIGVLIMVIFYELGFVASLSGLAMGVCAFMGYEFMAGEINTHGIIHVVVIIILMVYFTMVLCWAIDLHKAYGSLFSPGIFGCIREVFDTIRSDRTFRAAFFIELIQQYAFVAVGAVPVIIHAAKKRN